MDGADRGGWDPYAGTRRGRILVVDDDAGQAWVLATLLEDEGLAATAMIDSVRAAELVPGMFDAVIIDLEMPNVDGLELLARLRANDPTLPCVLVSGFSADEPRIAAALQQRGVMFVPKPISVNDLIERLHQLLGHLRCRPFGRALRHHPMMAAAPS